MVVQNIVCLFFLWLPTCLSKMCLVMTWHILVLPKHNFVSYYVGFGHVMNMRKHIMSITSVYYIAKMYTIGPKIGVGASSIFFSKRWIKPITKKKKRKHIVLLLWRPIANLIASPYTYVMQLEKFPWCNNMLYPL